MKALWKVGVASAQSLRPKQRRAAVAKSVHVVECGAVRDLARRAAAVLSHLLL